MLVGILDGLPAGVPIDVEGIDAQLRRRMQGHGRGKRMKIEADRVRFIGGVRHGETVGAPVAWLIENRDWDNWRGVMAPEPPAPGSGEERQPRSTRAVTRPRPGHADLAGGLKYARADLRDVLERASARETAARVAGGAVCRQLLARLGIDVASHVVRIGSVSLDGSTVGFEEIRERADSSTVRCVDDAVSARMIAEIDAAHDALDTVGGSFEVVARGVPAGLGSHVQWDRKLDGRLAHAMVSIPAMKGVEIGAAVEAAARRGSAVHDPIEWSSSARSFRRPTNRAGGIEGGVTNGEEVRVTVHMKPISTLRQPLPSVDVSTGETVDAVVQRGDTCAVPAGSVIGEAMMAVVLADASLEKFGGDSLEELSRNLDGYRRQLQDVGPPAVD
jgi:chorismate synthase